MTVRACARVLVSFALLAPGAPGIEAEGTDAVSPAAGPIENPAVLRFEILDGEDRAIPGRLTFVPAEGPPTPDLFPNAGARPDDLAVRKNTVASLSGRGAITVPPGDYTVYASRGIEWSIDSRKLSLEPGESAIFSARLRHEVDTSGWVSGDFHLHTLTYSGHGDSNLPERIITIVAEGLEFAVATDHNHHTDYRPTMRELGVDDELSTVTGNEVSVPIGHFNAFPLDPARKPPRSDYRDANPLFELLRAEPNEHGVRPIIQVNHPRWGSIDYFGQAGLDPVTGLATRATYCDDFDSVEVFNENAGWGYYDADLPGDRSVGAGIHSVLEDWFLLLNRGYRIAAVGNSDSHTVHSAFAAYPRNYVPSDAERPGEIRVADVAEAIRARRVFTTLGPFVEMTVDGAPMGSEVASEDRAANVSLRVQAASWIDCDRVKIVVNGDVALTLPVVETRAVERFRAGLRVPLRGDSWIAVLVEGDDPLAPVVPDHGRPILPLAVTNPVWVDADGDGEITSPYAGAVRAVRTAGSADEVFPPGVPPAERSLRLLAAHASPPQWAGDLARRGLEDDDRGVRKAAARLAERLSDAELLPWIAQASALAENDPYLDLCLVRAALACGAKKLPTLMAYVDRNGERALSRYGTELQPLLPRRFVSSWRVAGYFPNPDRETLTAVAYGPETSTDPAATFAGKSGTPVTWSERQTGENGYLDLLDPRGASDLPENAIAYAETWLVSPDEREVPFALGTDDGCRLLLNGEPIVEAVTRRGASPWQHFGKLPLRAGRNRVLVKVENGTGDFGLYFQVFDAEVSARIP